MNILSIGVTHGTTLHRIRAMERLGHTVATVNPALALKGNRLALRWSAKTGALGLSGVIDRYVREAVGTRRFDMVIVDGGEFLGPSTVRWLKTVAPAVVLNNLDNPFSDRDGHRWRLLLRALPHYHAFFTVRESTAQAARDAGIEHAIRVWHCADEVEHQPRALSPEEQAEWGSDVAFVGTWMPGRETFLVDLIRRGVPLRIFGDRWTRAPQQDLLAPHLARTRGLNPTEYATAINGAKIGLGFVSKGNRDFVTNRTMEIPAVRTLLCAERTEEHLMLYEEDEEAVFWDTSGECADKCLALLADPDRLARIAQAGHERAHRNGHFNEPMMQHLIEQGLAAAASR